jgi:soluble lytic murein transglycosylase
MIRPLFSTPGTKTSGWAWLRLLTGLIVLTCMSFGAQAKPQPRPAEQPAIVAAKKAFDAKDSRSLKQAADRLAKDPLAVWADYWLVRLNVQQRPFDKKVMTEIEAFQTKHNGHVLTQAILKDWAIVSLDQGPWAQSSAIIRGLPDNLDHPAIACARARLSGQPTAGQAALVVGQESSKTCIGLAQSLIEARLMGRSEIMHRARWAALAGDLSHAERLWQTAKTIGLMPPAHEDGLLKLLAASRIHPTQALDKFQTLSGQWSAEQRGFAQLSIGAWLWVRSHPKAWTMTKSGLSSVTQQPSQIQELVARQALRQADWQAVLAATDNMPDETRQKDVWLFWRSKALEVLGHPDTAKDLLRQVEPGLGFYSLLASEALGRDWLEPYLASPKPEAIKAAHQRLVHHPSTRRALSLAKAGLRAEAVIEWNHLTSGLRDPELVALADIAYKANVPDRAIAAAIRTKQLHALDLRYPSLFAQEVVQNSQQKGVSGPWVIGLIRQESRFITDIKSPVGAMGLMQIMPSTAQMLAKETGDRRFKLGQLSDPGANIRLGTHYMAQLRNQFGGSIVLATAAYNAGPSRSKLWRASLSGAIEGAAFAESIPFTETRDYVKAVTANTAVYQRLMDQGLIKVSLQQTPQRLVDLLGTITP